MSTHINNYVVYGVKFDGYDDAFSDYYYGSDYCSKYHEEDGPVDVILDGMSGNYMVFGKILSVSGNYGNEMPEAGEIIEVDISTLGAVETEYRKLFVENFPDFNYLIDNKPFKILVFTHWH